MESREGVSGLIILPLGTHEIPSACLVLLVSSIMAIPTSSHHVRLLPLRLNLYLVLKSLPKGSIYYPYNHEELGTVFNGDFTGMAYCVIYSDYVQASLLEHVFSFQNFSSCF